MLNSAQNFGPDRKSIKDCAFHLLSFWLQHKSAQPDLEFSKKWLKSQKYLLQTTSKSSFASRACLTKGGFSYLSIIAFASFLLLLQPKYSSFTRVPGCPASRWRTPENPKIQFWVLFQQSTSLPPMQLRRFRVNDLGKRGHRQIRHKGK
jgi:hypothetical protein